MKSINTSDFEEVKDKSLFEILQAKHFYLACEDLTRKYNNSFFYAVLSAALDHCYLHADKGSVITPLKSIKDDALNINNKIGYKSLESDWQFIMRFASDQWKKYLHYNFSEITSPFSRIVISTDCLLKEFDEQDDFADKESYLNLVNTLQNISNSIKTVQQMLNLREWRAILEYDTSKVDVNFAIDYKAPVIYNGKKAIINSFVDSENVVLICEADDGIKVSGIVPVNSEFSWFEQDSLYSALSKQNKGS